MNFGAPYQSSEVEKPLISPVQQDASPAPTLAMASKLPPGNFTNNLGCHPAQQASCASKAQVPPPGCWEKAKRPTKEQPIADDEDTTVMLRNFPSFFTRS